MATTRPPDDDPHHCAWREWAEVVETRLSEFEKKLARLDEVEKKLEALLGRVHQSEKLPRIADEVRGEREIDPRKTREVRAARAEMKARLIEEKIELRVPERERHCPKCGKDKLRRAGEKTSTVYEYIAGYFRRQVHVRETLACACGEYIVTAPCPEKSTDKTRYGPGFIAHLLTAKCADSIPLYRLEKQYARAGVPIARSTMTDLFHRNAELVEPLSSRLLALVAEQDIVQADETSLRRLDVKKRGYLWTFLAQVDSHDGGADPKPLIAYVFSPDRSGKTPSAVLGASSGTLLVDGYTGYNVVTTPERRERAGCLAHARRKLFAAMEQHLEAREALDIIRDVYVVEHDAKSAGVARTSEHLAMRRARTKPLMDKLFAWLKEREGLHPPKSLIGRAIRYALSNWTELTRFLEDARIPPDNNRSEAALRVAALGRKNFLFVGHEQAGKNIAGVYALVVTCEANGVNPLDYLRDVLVRISTPGVALDDLLPHRWTSAT
ncbi:MAG: IS66 family transposase [Polyangiaceae bacterium]